MKTSKKKILSREGEETTIPIPPGIKELRIIKVTVPKIHHSSRSSLGKLLWWIEENSNRSEIELKESICENKDGILTYTVDQSLSTENGKSFKFRHFGAPRNLTETITLHYQLKAIETLNVIKPEVDFEAHLENYDNSKIVFSAPFGDGKTTFLDYFFEKRKEKYEVFKVFPVNYSVASNEDVFKYIKADILFQLFGKDIDFDTEGIKLREAVSEYIYLNPFKSVISFVEQISKLSKQTELIGKTITAVNKLIKPVLDYQKSKEVNDKKSSEDFISQLYLEEGSLLEDNLITQMIRQLLSRLKETNPKKTVLIIEDLDRMDPDHIFRILNVISAHYDTYMHSEDEETHNKFGFDKIIVVCDVKNIRSIFEHRYGSSVHFEGYFNKFFSTKPFEYDNKKAMTDFVNKLLNRPHTYNHFHSNKYYSSLVFLFELFIENDLLTLRDLVKTNSLSYDKFIEDKNNAKANSHNYYELRQHVMFYALSFLNEILLNDVMNKFKHLKTRPLRSDTRYDEFASDMIVGLARLKKKAPIEYDFNEVVYSFEAVEDEAYGYIVAKSGAIYESESPDLFDVSKKEVGQSVRFDQNDFFDLLILTAKEVLPVTR